METAKEMAAKLSLPIKFVPWNKERPSPKDGDCILLVQELRASWTTHDGHVVSNSLIRKWDFDSELPKELRTEEKDF
jgi:hypothetical protein